VPLLDSFAIYKYARKPVAAGMAPTSVRDLIRDHSYTRVERIGDKLTRQYEDQAPSGAPQLACSGQRILADLPVGSYVGCWRMGGQSCTALTQPWIALEFSVAV
jgi:hypothetical protein